MERKSIIGIVIVVIAVITTGGIIGGVVLLSPQSPSLTLIDADGTSTTVSWQSIYEGIILYREQVASDTTINEYKDVIIEESFIDPITGQNVTGVDILGILEKYDIWYARDLKFSSTTTSDSLERSTADLIRKNYAKRGATKFYLIYAIDGEMLAQTAYYSEMGDFAIMGENTEDRLYKIDKIEVLNEWTIDLVVNEIVVTTLDPNYLTSSPQEATYSFDTDYGWSANRKYWGKEMTTIVSEKAEIGSANYELWVSAVDGYTSPFLKKENPYSKDEVENGVIIPRSNDDYIDEDLTTPIPDTDLLMTLSFKIQEFGEKYNGIEEEAWPELKNFGYQSGPFNLQIPGRNRRAYAMWIDQIHITTL